MELELSTLLHDPFQVLADDRILLCDWKQYRQRNTVADLVFTFSRACVPLLVRIWLPWFFPLWLFKSESKKPKTRKNSPNPKVWEFSPDLRPESKSMVP